MMSPQLVFLFLIIACVSVNEISAGKKLIVVLVDGFKWDYVNDPKLSLRGIPKIIENGVRAPYVNPVYPSLSYPNWYSIVTGLYPENHNIVNNVMYDVKTGESFLMFPNETSTQERWWNGAEPIWVTAEKQRKPAALYFWLGCEVRIKGVQPTICERHRVGPVSEEEKKDYLERIDDIIQMFKPPEKDRLSLALIFYDPVDGSGHKGGPGKSETRKALKDIDDILYEMLDKIEKAGLKDEVNVMVVSDHGMTDVSKGYVKYIDLDKFSPNIKFQVSGAALSMLVPEDGMVDKLYGDLKAENITGIEVYKKEDIPESFHLKKSPLVNDIFIKADKGYYIRALSDEKKRIGVSNGKIKGHHGYHPDDVPDMRTIFFATGPGFRKGITSKPLNNTDLYNLMCNVLHITALPNNGSVELVKDLLAEENTAEPFTKSSAFIAAHNSLCLIILLCSVFMLQLLIFKHH